MFNYSKTTNTPTPQTEKAHNKQVKNSAGGYSFAPDNWKRLERFLILGSDSNTYYASARQLTKENASSISACLDEDYERTIETAAAVSEKGRAPKNDPAIFVLALGAAHKNPKARKMALEVMPKVCRTGTHLFHFVDMVNELRGWGRGLRNGVANWYNSKDINRLAYQMVKYQSRDGWSHKDVLKLCHAEGPSADHNAAYRWAVGADLGKREVKRVKGDKTETVSYEPVRPPMLIKSYESLKETDDVKQAIRMIKAHGFTHEMIPSKFKNDPEIWEALLEKMPLGALIRNLGKLSNVGIVKPLSEGTKQVVAKLTNKEAIKRARIHPLSVLVALNTYKRGRGVKGSLSWNVVPQVVSTLDDLFYVSFDEIEPTGKNILMGIDVSGSMTIGQVGGMTGITPNIGAAAMAMVTARAEDNYYIHGFSSTFRDLRITSGDSLGVVQKKTQSISFGRTDCSLPMRYAQENKLEVDVFKVFTDNETYAGPEHPHVSLERYRQAMGRNAKLCVVGMISNGFSIANPDDPGMLDIVGFDTSAPAVMADFARG